MPQRFLKPGLITSKKWDGLSWIGQSFYIRLLTLVDDFGRFEADDTLLRSLAFPLREDIRTLQVQQLKQELQANQLADFYKADEKDYLQLRNWTERARADKSKYPEAPKTSILRNPAESCGILPSSSSSPPSPSFLVPAKLRESSVGVPTWEEVREYAMSVHCGIAEWKARDWFDEMEGCGWLDHAHRPIDKWRSVLNRVKVKWEGDGRPTGPPKATNGHAERPARAMTPLDIKTIRDAKITLADSIKAKYAAEGALGTTWSSEVERRDWIKLRGEIRELNNRLSGMA